MNLKNWQILKNGKRSDFAVIVIITMIFLIVIELNVRLIFQMTSNQTEEIGKMQLEVIRSDFQGTLQEAENATLRVATEAEQLLKLNTPHKDLEEFFDRRKREQKNLTGGVCFNVYIANKDWAIIPDFNMPPEYHASERLWYKGATQNPGKVYITEPYIDAMTGMMCFTISKMLSDNRTVVALDFTFSEVQYFIRKMSTSGEREALIVTKSGMIIGYTDMDLVGEKISKRLPEYESILNRVVSTERNESFTTEMSDGEHTIFSSSTPNGWYIILNVDNWAFYKESYMQIIFTALICLLMMIAIIFFYLNAMRNGLRAENALRIKEEFLSRLSHELRDPVKKILNLSSMETINSDVNPAECAAQVRESALKLSDMLENLFSFSTIVSGDKNKFADKKILQNDELAKVSRYARIRIIMVLIFAMVLAFGICLTMTISWGNTKMNREVDAYDYQLSNWLEKEKSILGMFVNIISNHPEYMKDYPNAVKFLNDLAKKYPEISVCYLANPYNEHQVIMNNGWESPDPSWRVNKRPWYIEAERSEDGFSVSAPYYDSQTGLYCITLAQIVYGKNHDFLGIFAIDFYLDRLIKILDISYTKDSYAFLVDRNNVIINHPNIDYQQSTEHMTDISNTEYANVFPGSGVHTLRDYNDNLVACLAKRDSASNFTVVVTNGWWNIYGNNVLLGGLFIILLVMCILIINGLIDRLFKWQESMNHQLKTASDTALAASQAKSQFLAQMSHEIRTPINAVLGMNEMILRESKSEEILDYATNIKSAGRTLLTLINSILDFSKIEDGKMEIVPVRYDTINLIDDLVNMTVERAKNKGIEFKTEIDSNLPQSLYGDDVRVRQVIVNLLTNAVKYTPAGSVTLTIDGKIIDADNYEMRVKVRDTGIGIHEDDIDKLFLSFQRLDDEKTRNIEGTGLGISIVQKLLDMMDSKLEVESVYGKGSTFSFTLRQKIIDKNPIGNFEEEHKKHVDKNEEKKYLTAEGAKVLAVDDNDMNLKVITGLLKRNKIYPDIAESGQEGIDLVKKNFYHIIFMDNMMPDMSGVETLKVMKRDKILSNETSVVMLTASAIAGVREEYLREGFDDYLSKPINVSELELILERHLPAEMVSFEIENAIRNEELGIRNVEVEEPEEIVGEDEFTKREKKIFAETCPDVNLEVALQYCMNSKSFLTQMFTTYIDAKRADKIQAAFDSEDWKNYQILVHALKSTSLSIGAENLSKLAKHLELAAKENNVEKILANHAALMTDYKKVREEIGQWLKF